MPPAAGRYFFDIPHVRGSVVKNHCSLQKTICMKKIVLLLLVAATASAQPRIVSVDTVCVRKDSVTFCRVVQVVREQTVLLDDTFAYAGAVLSAAGPDTERIRQTYAVVIDTYRSLRPLPASAIPAVLKAVHEPGKRFAYGVSHKLASHILWWDGVTRTDWCAFDAKTCTIVSRTATVTRFLSWHRPALGFVLVSFLGISFPLILFEAETWVILVSHFGVLDLVFMVWVSIIPKLLEHPFEDYWDLIVYSLWYLLIAVVMTTGLAWFRAKKKQKTRYSLQ